MERTEEALRERVRETPLNERLKTCEKYIASMCAERRPPKMTIPLQHYDEDFYICTTLADAQATIAALQEERDGWVRSREHYYQLWMRATDERDEMRKERDEFESELTQRNIQCLFQCTAELEAAKRERDVWYARYNELSGVKDRQLNDLQAELERVREELADERTAYKALSEQYNRLDLEHSDRRTLQAELERGRGLVRALPAYKDISVSHRIDENDYESWHVWVDHNPLAECDTEEEANAIKALYEHRQGMEG